MVPNLFSVMDLLTIWLKAVDPFIKPVNTVTYRGSAPQKVVIRFACHKSWMNISWNLPRSRLVLLNNQNIKRRGGQPFAHHTTIFSNASTDAPYHWLFLVPMFFNIISDLPGILQIWISQVRPRFAFNQFHARKMLFACARHSKTTFMTPSEFY